ncbi:MAG: carboxypeptidase-like regulatory domain-containing protein [Bryobacteraceae bacterium]
MRVHRPGPLHQLLQLCLALLVAVIPITTLSAQIMEGELHVTVRDQTGRAVAARVELAGRNPQFRTEAQADSAGNVRLRRLPQGIYRLAVTHNGFETFSDTIEIRSAVPQEREITLKVGAVATGDHGADERASFRPLRAGAGHAKRA